MSAVVSGSSLIAMGVAAVATTLLPVGLLVLLGVKRWISLTPLLLGFASFLVSQVLTRIPLLSVLNQLPAFQGFASAHGVLYGILVGGVSAGLFEESARLGGALLLKGKCAFQDAVSFGLGHGFCEMILLVGTTQLNNLCLSLLLNTGRIDLLNLPAQMVESLTATLTGTAPGLFYIAILERVFAALYHLSATILIFWGVVHGKKLLCWLGAVGCHTLFNSIAVLLSGRFSIWAAEGAMALLAVGMALAVWRLRESFPKGKTPAA